ncbi:zinc finger protein 780B-like isoform X3 [Cloeon dipterum]|uniref:zinc finger protein 780B-like isoform X3 n=1 Tax=Cloeon dipterum TaxID=197152 RepID=UPI00321FF01D
MKLRGKEGKAPIQKPLCRLCECPTSDGHVLASQVDRFKLRKWAMEVMNLTEEDENLPDVVEEDALICYFCIWQAEFGDESGDESVAWWPKKLDLEENARVLRENYSVGEVEQCWVQLEEVELAKNTKKIAKKRKYFSGDCIYCGNSYNHLMEHVKYMHKEAIKCGFPGCRTYFHTEEDKEQHMQQVSHEKRSKPRREIRKILCKYCEKGKLYSTVELWRRHMDSKHPEQVLCTQYGCNEYFKSKPEMILHVNSAHKRGLNQDLFQCKHCDHFATLEYNLRRHEESKHMPKIFKCDKCDAKFGSKVLVKLHSNKYHTIDKCKTCGQDVFHGHKAFHRKASVCSKCKVSFKCLGLYQLHGESCKQTPFTCKECGKAFKFIKGLNRHVKTVHTKSVRNFGCEHCDYSASNKYYMLNHMTRQHLPKTIKCEKCSKMFPTKCLLKNHKSKAHSFVRCAECSRKLRRDSMYKHRRAQTCGRCECKLKCQGLLDMHICPRSNNIFCCDMCPDIFGKKRSLYAHIVKEHFNL